MYLDIGRLALESRADLMDQDLGVRKRHALALRAARQEQGAHAHRDAHADRLDVGLHELHRVVDREAGIDRAARRVDVDRDVLVGILGLEVQELSHDEIGDLVVDGRAEEDDALVQQARVDVERPLAARRLLDHHRNQWAHCTPQVGRLAPAGVQMGVCFSPERIGFLPRRPQLALRLGLLGRDRLGVLDHDVERLLRGQVLAKRGRRGRDRRAAARPRTRRPRRRRRPARAPTPRSSRRSPRRPRRRPRPRGRGPSGPSPRRAAGPMRPAPRRTAR